MRKKPVIDMPQEDWSDYASPTGPDTQQADMVSREKVIELLDKAERQWVEGTPNPSFGYRAATILGCLKEEVRKL